MENSMIALDRQGKKVDVQVKIDDLENGELGITLVNQTDADIHVWEVKVHSGNFQDFSKNAMIYADGYEMLSQFYKKLSQVTPDDSMMTKGHYKMPQKDGFVVAYNYMYVEQPGKVMLVGATSCRKFYTECRFNNAVFEISQMLNGIKVPKKGELRLESIAVIYASDRNEALDIYGKMINSHHERRFFPEIPDGWCSWYCYGPTITKGGIIKNLRSAKAQGIKGIKYIQIDDGYQPHMGDWLIETRKFGNMKALCKKIKAEGFEPAIWVAPFIASKKSRLLKKHPDWFIKDENNKPLSAEKCTFKGWRDAPWYFLDPTHPEALNYIKLVFHIMKNEWGVNYFKLDANAWGAMPFGKRYDDTVTCVEAYRIGMRAIRETVGPNTFVLGCNAPMFPSIGEVTGMRVTMDVMRDIQSIKGLASQCFFRNWMHNVLWTNDPDCLVQTDAKTKLFGRKNNNEKAALYRYAAAFVRASGGMMLSGDKLFKLSEYDKRIMNQILNSERTAAKFNFDYSMGIIDCANKNEYLCFNSNENKSKKFTLPCTGRVYDVFADKYIQIKNGYEFELGANDARWFTEERK